jgi:5-methyltetrahydropteroyltriglutamate--homocysteine methyltransferase
MNAPYRADHVGSLLRPAWLTQARSLVRSGEMHPLDLVHIEDRAVLDAIHRQQNLGLRSVTDGEYRREWWHLDFLSQLDGVTVTQNTGEKFKLEGQSEQPPMATVTGKIGCSTPIMKLDFAFLDTMSQVPAKMTIPSPSMLHLRGGRAGISREVYPDLEEFWADVAAAYRIAIAHYAEMGCRYLQFDDVSFAYLCDPKIRANCRANGDDPDALPMMYARAIDAAMEGKHPDMRVTIHTCRGNFKSAWVAEGGYAPVVEAMFSTKVDGFFMEFDSERAGSFEPLRALPAGKQVVLGLVTTKVGELESKDFLKRRIDEAARVVPLDRLALSPQCGFASTHHGNALTEDEQWRKLERVVEVAREVWADA